MIGARLITGRLPAVRAVKLAPVIRRAPSAPSVTSLTVSVSVNPAVVDVTVPSVRTLTGATPIRSVSCVTATLMGQRRSSVTVLPEHVSVRRVLQGTSVIDVPGEPQEHCPTVYHAESASITGTGSSWTSRVSSTFDPLC